MFDFFQALADFLKSDLAKGYGWTIFVLIIICICLSCFVFSLIMNKLIFPSRSSELNNKVMKLERENIYLKKLIKELKVENDKLKKANTQYKFFECIDDDADFENNALKDFVKEEKEPLSSSLK